MAATDPVPDTTIRIKRVFKAPIERVFKACSELDLLRQWWAAPGYRIADVTIDPKTGRGHQYTMVGDGGDRYVWQIDYQLIEEPTKLKWTSTPIEGFGGQGMTRAMLEFRQVPGGTEVTLTHEGFPDKDTRDAHQNGWGGGFGNLEKLLASGT
jgi:uncharacterized protein YndB with AHSA1/START domain